MAEFSQWINPMVWDVIVFFGFLFLVVFIGISMSRKSQDSGESYFLAGRGLAWWLIGFSLIAANISTEQFVGMSGQASTYIGLAVASYEWIAAVALVVVALFFLPKFLKSGIYTIPEFLEYRYNKLARTIMSLSMMVTLVGITSAVVIYSGAKQYTVFFKDVDLILEVSGKRLFDGNPLNLTSLAWVIGIVAAVYVFLGGLKACAWADLLQGSALILCGGCVLWFALNALQKADVPTMQEAMQVMDLPQDQIAQTVPKLEAAPAIERFQMINNHKLRMNLPWTDSILPITALFFGIWIPNLYYWGLNQFIMQRTLGAKSLGEGQKGVVFAAFLKLLIPFIVIFPGIIAFNLYHSDMKESRQEGFFGREYIRAKRDGTLSSDRINAIKMDGARKKIEANNRTNLLFKYDEKFVQFEPEATQMLISYNAEKLKVVLPPGISPMAAQKEIEKANQKLPVPFRYAKELNGYDSDAAFPILVNKLIPPGGLQGFVLAAIFGTIVSTLAAMMNAASTMFTMDIYKQYFHKKASDRILVVIGRFCVILFVIISCLIAPYLDDPKYGGVFTFIQEFQGFISPGILAAFLFGFIVPRAARWSGVAALLLGPATFGLLKYSISFISADTHPVAALLLTSFLNRMVITFLVVLIMMTLLTLIWPKKEAFQQQVTTKLNMQASPLAFVVGILIVAATIALYVYFWDHKTPMFPSVKQPAAAAVPAVETDLPRPQEVL
ncbi:MAG: hypothetical protein LBQ54_05505 [Planctomycetaceae bacterium]|jgi:SSS family solute:Na+ symporter|nr:hypothetical protein [Planctomycetaceae bacterium]